MTDRLLASVRQTIRTHQLLPAQARVIVGVSGGPDSVVLLHVLTQLQQDWKLHLHVVHVDHGLREDSREDAAFVLHLSERWQLPATIERIDVARRCAEEGWSLEDGARRLRYDCFLRIATRQSASHVALAHTADDQAETVLMRLLRGTGLLGLGAMALKRRLDGVSLGQMQRSGARRAVEETAGTAVWVVRPLLLLWRRDILAYLAQERLEFREDLTNQDSRFVRNRIRHELLPLLEQHYNPNIKGMLTQLAEQSQSDYTYLQQAADRQWKRLAKSPAPRRVAIAIRPFMRQPKALQRQLVRHAIVSVRGDLSRFEFRHWREAEQLFAERPVGTLLDLPGGVQLRREQERVVCQLASRTTPSVSSLE